MKSAGAVIVGFVVLTILSIITDSVLQKAGVMKTEPFDANPVWLIAIIVAYRTVFSILGFYLAARLAPSKPMKYSFILEYDDLGRKTFTAKGNVTLLR